ncbi:hypothetical protein ACOMHN_048738 [Nucella lapillus]
MEGVPDVPYRCPRCGGARTFTTLAELKSHMTEEHAYNAQRRRRLRIFDYSPTHTSSPHSGGRHSPLLQTFLAENQRLEEELKAAKQEELNNQLQRQRKAQSQHPPSKTSSGLSSQTTKKSRAQKPKVNFRTPLPTQEPDTYLQESLSHLNHEMLVQRHQQWRTADALYSTQDVLSGVEEAAEDRVSEQKNFISDLSRQLAEKEQQLLALRAELEKVRTSEKDKDEVEEKNQNRSHHDSDCRERQSIENELQKKKRELDNLNKQLEAARHTDNRVKDAPVPNHRKLGSSAEKNRQQRREGGSSRPHVKENSAADVSSQNTEGSDDSTTAASVSASRTSSSSLRNRTSPLKKTRHSLPTRSPENSQPRLSSLPQRHHQHIHNKLRQDNQPHQQPYHSDRLRSQKLKEERQLLVQQMKELLSKANIDNEKLKDELLVKENHLQFLNQELQRTKTDQSELMEETYDLYKEAEKSLAKLKDRLKGKESQLEQANSKLDDIHHAHERLVAEKETAEKSSDDKDVLYQNMMRDREQEIQSLKGLLETQQEERAKLKQVADELKEEISEKEKSQEQLSLAIATKGEELAKAREDIDTLTQFLQTAAAKESVARGKLEAFVTELIDRADHAERELNHLRDLESTSSGNITTDPLLSGGHPLRNVKNVNAALAGRNPAASAHSSAKIPPQHGRHPRRSSRMEADPGLQTGLDPWYTDLGGTTVTPPSALPLLSSVPAVQPQGSVAMAAGFGMPELSSVPRSASLQQLPGHNLQHPQGKPLWNMQQHQQQPVSHSLQQIQPGPDQSLPSPYLVEQPVSLQGNLQGVPLSQHSYQAPSQLVHLVSAQQSVPQQQMVPLQMQGMLPQQTLQTAPLQMQGMLPQQTLQTAPQQMQQMVPQQAQALPQQQAQVLPQQQAQVLPQQQAQVLPQQQAQQMLPQQAQISPQGGLCLPQHTQQIPQQQSPQFMPQPTTGQRVSQGLQQMPSNLAHLSGGPQDSQLTSMGVVAQGPSFLQQQSLPQSSMLPPQQYHQQQNPQGLHQQAPSASVHQNPSAVQRSPSAVSPQPGAPSQGLQQRQPSPAGQNNPPQQSPVSQSGAHAARPDMVRRNTNPFSETYTLQPAPSLSVSELSEDLASLPAAQTSSPGPQRSRNRNNPHIFQPPLLSPLGSERDESSAYAELPTNGGGLGRMDSNPFRNHLSSSMLSRQPAAYDDADERGGRGGGRDREGASPNSHNFMVYSSGKVLHKDRFSSVSSNPFKEEMSRSLSPASAYKSNMFPADGWKGDGESSSGGQRGVNGKSSSGGQRGVNGKFISPDRTYPIYCITGREARDLPWDDVSDSNGSFQDTPHFNMAVVHRKPRSNRGKGQTRPVSGQPSNQYPKKVYRYRDDSSTDGLELSVDENGILWEAADSMSEASESYRISPYGSETAGDVDTSVLMSSHHASHRPVARGGQDTDEDVDSLDDEGVVQTPKENGVLRISDEGILRSNDEILRPSEEKVLHKSEAAMLRLSEDDLEVNAKKTSRKRENPYPMPLDERITRILKTVDREEDSEHLDMLREKKENSFPRRHLMDRSAAVYGTYRRGPQPKTESPLERALAVQNRVKSLTYPRSGKKSVTISDDLTSEPKSVPANRKSIGSSAKSAGQRTYDEPAKLHQLKTSSGKAEGSPRPREESPGSAGGSPRSTENSLRSAEDSMQSTEGSLLQKPAEVSLRRTEGSRNPIGGSERPSGSAVRPGEYSDRSAAQSSQRSDGLEDFSSSSYASIPAPQKTKGNASKAANKTAETSNGVHKETGDDQKASLWSSANGDISQRAGNALISKSDESVTCEVATKRPQADGGRGSLENTHANDHSRKQNELVKNAGNNAKRGPAVEEAISRTHPPQQEAVFTPSPEYRKKTTSKTTKLSSIQTQPSSNGTLTRQKSVTVEETELQQFAGAPLKPARQIRDRASPTPSASSMQSSETESVCVSPPLALPPPQPRDKGDDDSTDFDLESDLEKFVSFDGGVKRGVVAGKPGSKKLLRKLKLKKVGGRKQGAHISAPDTPEDNSSNVSDSETTSRSERREAARRRRVALFCIFSHLDSKSLCKAALVCKEWKRVSRHPSLWKHVYLKYDRISPQFLVTLAQWCTQISSLTLEGLRAGSRKPSETLDEYQRRTRGCLEPGLEELLKASQDSLTSLSIVACGNLLTEKCMWLVSGYCRLMQRLTYLSDSHPLTAEVMWALGGGCPSITSLVIPPLFPCHGSEGMTNRCLMLIAQFYPDLLEVGVGGRTIDLTGLVPLVQSCQRLTSLCIDHIKELGDDTATALCRAGLRQLHQLELSGTPVTAKAIKIFHSSCHHLTEIRVFVCINDFFDDVRKKKNKEEYKKIAKSLEALKMQPGLGNVLQVRAAPIE